MDQPDQLIERYFAAMRRGSEAETEMLGLFADDAVYIEPFSGQEPAEGIEAIGQRLRQGWEVPLPDLELDVLEVEIAGTEARSLWECRSPALTGPRRGEDRYHFADGKIVRLEVRFLE